MKRLLVPAFGAAFAVLVGPSLARAQGLVNALSVQHVRPLIPCCTDACGDCCSCPWPSPVSCCTAKPALAPFESAGAPPYLATNWNIASGNGGVLLPSMIMDANGNPTHATVLWEAPRFTDSPVDQVLFTDSNQKLMSGYLDQPDDTSAQLPTFIQITGIPASISDNYDVVIYTLTPAANAFGLYSVNGGDPKYVVAGGNGTLTGPDFVEAIGDDPTFASMSDYGNYVVFRGLSGSTVTITATNATGGRAPVNAVQVARTQ